VISSPTDVQEPAPPAAAVAISAARSCRIHFTGTGQEYFRIWIVNLLLTIATLGIYSAWAKVRKMQYLHRNTHLDGSVFDYHGEPIAILKGRLLAVALLVAYKFALPLLGGFGLIAVVAVIASIPWLLTQSYRFKLRNTSYRGLHFRFAGPVWHAYLIVGLPAMLMLAAAVLAALGMGGDPQQVSRRHALGIGMAYLALMALWPYLHFCFKRWQHGHVLYGTSRARFEAYAGDFYGPYAVGGIFCAASIVGLALVVGLGTAGETGAVSGRWAGVALLWPLLFYVVVLAIVQFVKAWLQNTVWSSTRLEGVRLSSDVHAGRLIGITLSNLAMIVLSLGLMIPFAVMRQTKYRIESIRVLDADELGRFVADAAGSRVGAAGEGTVDLMDLDFGL